MGGATPRAGPAVLPPRHPELWAGRAGSAGSDMHFDAGPDGSYFDGDRIARKAVDDLPWPERAPHLRRAGVRTS